MPQDIIRIEIEKKGDVLAGANNNLKKKEKIQKLRFYEQSKLISYIERKSQDRKAKRDQEGAADRSARHTATATRWIAGFTIVLAAVGIGTLHEVIVGGNDTHTLAMAAVMANRAWVAPEQVLLVSPVESGLPLKYQIRIVNPGKEPALGVVWKVRPFGVPYIREVVEPNALKFAENSTCSSLKPRNPDGMVLYPAGQTNYWLPLSVPDTPENVQLIDAVLRRTKSLVIEGCFAYVTDGEGHTSSFRYLLRDLPNKASFATDKEGNYVPAWNFNTILTGNQAN